MIHPLGARASVYDSRLSFLLSLFFLSWTLTPPVSQEAKKMKNFDLRPFGIRTRTKNLLNRHNSLSFYLNESLYLFLRNFDWKFFFSTLKKFDRFELKLSFRSLFGMRSERIIYVIQMNAFELLLCNFVRKYFFNIVF